MRLLLTNDDGVHAPGLAALSGALSDTYAVTVVAPSSERSAMSHSLTMHKPLRVVDRGDRRYSVSGTPADCVYVALYHVLPEPPDLVVSGINHGSNLGSDVHYSGTVAAAREAALHGLPSIAVSLHRSPGDQDLHWVTAATVAARVVRAVLQRGLPPLVFLNVNVPNLPLEGLRGLKTTRLGDRAYTKLVDERLDPRGRPYVWVGGAHEGFGTDPETDGVCAENGWATVTPLSAQITAEDQLAAIREWTDA